MVDFDNYIVLSAYSDPIQSMLTTPFIMQMQSAVFAYDSMLSHFQDCAIGRVYVLMFSRETTGTFYSIAISNLNNIKNT